MSGPRNDRIEILNYLKQSVKRMREFAQTDTGQLGEEMRELANEIVQDTAKLEAELVEAVYLPGATSASD
ncbi:MAG TPA: hypothetical protein VG328_06845 [Stellaceae bacterium]|jgi:hypothetical protein|nr:hypothetical protein [Stellaceae bacterium]